MCDVKSNQIESNRIESTAFFDDDDDDDDICLDGFVLVILHLAKKIMPSHILLLSSVSFVYTVVA